MGARRYFRDIFHFQKFPTKYRKTPSESFAGRQICIFASIQLTDTVQNETNFYIQGKCFVCEFDILKCLELQFNLRVNCGDLRHAIFLRQICFASIFWGHGDSDHRPARGGSLLQLPGLQPGKPNCKLSSSSWQTKV